MENKIALIVDDSRTASHVLRRMLEKDEFQVEVRDSAEEAIEYLDAGRPGVIFMDHMMPGMDGFQAVKAIKSKSDTASIPIVMYTSKSGELYIGQARALGAADILLKPPTRQSLAEVFERLDARQQAAAEEAEVLDSPPQPVVVETPVTQEERTEAPAPAAASSATPSVQREPMLPEERDTGITVRTVLLAMLLGLIAGYALSRFLDSGSEEYAGLEWAFSANPSFAYGEMPFGGSRVDLVRQLLTRLEAQGFSGVVELEGHTGAFCLVQEGTTWTLPQASLPIESCGLIGHGIAESRRMSGQQSAEFRNLLDSSPMLENIRVQLLPRGDGAPRLQYPSQRDVRTAGDWNRIAAQNNRIEIRLLPD